MAVPTEADIKKKANELAEHLKQLDSSGRLTEKKLVSMLRSAIRQVWMAAPNKLAKLELARIPDMDSSTRTKWLFKCEKCGGLFKGTDVQVDHIHGNHQFIELKDFENFCNKILNASLDDLQVLCIEEHECKTWLEANGYDWTNEEHWSIGIATKKAITTIKEKKDKIFLQEKGITPASNQEKRREQLIKWFEDNKDARI